MEAEKTDNELLRRPLLSAPSTLPLWAHPTFANVINLVDGILRLMDSNTNDPVNIGNPREVTIDEITLTINQAHRIEEPD